MIEPEVSVRNLFYAAFCLLLHPQTARAQVTSGMVEVAPDIRIFYQKFGSGPQVVVIPGRLFHEAYMSRLASRDRTILLYDMRNRGASQSVARDDAIGIEKDVEDVEAIRRWLKAERVSLIGYSYLGLVTAIYASRHPERIDRLVQIAPVPIQWDTEFSKGQQLAGEESLSPEGLRARRDWEAAEKTLTPENDEHLCRLKAKASAYWTVGNPANAERTSYPCRYRNEWPLETARHLQLHFGDLQRRSYPQAAFASLRFPVLIFHGTRDRNAPYGSGLQWARTFPDARLITVKDGAHNLWLDDDALVSNIDAFLGGAWPSRAISSRNDKAAAAS